MTAEHPAPAVADAGLSEAEDDRLRDMCAVCLGDGCRKCEELRDEVERILRAHVQAATDRAKAEERERWVAALSPLCDDEWLRHRDRAMELPGVKGHRWERRASSAWEQAANGVRSVLNVLADYEEEYVGRHEAYMRWLRDGRDEGRAGGDS